MSFDIRQLEHFLVAARLLNFTRAAEELYITQSALSKQISALEAAVGTELFRRRNNLLSLTTAGDLLYREGAELLEKMKNIEYLMQEAAVGTTGAITVAMQDVLFSIAPSLFESFRERHPQVTLRARFILPQLIPAAIASGEADAGTIFSFDLGMIDGGDFGIFKLIRERYAMIVPPTHPLAGRESARLEDFRDDTILILDKISSPEAIVRMRERSRQRCAQLEQPHPSPGSFDDLMLQVSLGLGVLPIISSIAHNNHRGNAVIDLENSETDVDVLLTWKKSNRNPVLPLFIDLVREKFPGGDNLS